jgi:hypothetical protein
LLCAYGRTSLSVRFNGLDVDGPKAKTRVSDAYLDGRDQQMSLRTYIVPRCGRIMQVEANALSVLIQRIQFRDEQRESRGVRRGGQVKRYLYLDYLQHANLTGRK